MSYLNFRISKVRIKVIVKGGVVEPDRVEFFYNQWLGNGYFTIDQDRATSEIIDLVGIAYQLGAIEYILYQYIDSDIFYTITKDQIVREIIQ